MFIIDSIARTLSFPSNSPERNLLKEKAKKVMNSSAVISLCVGGLFIGLSIYGESLLDSTWRCRSFLAGAASIFTGQELGGICCNLASASDQLWTSHAITGLLFEKTVIAGKLFSRIVEARLNRIMMPAWTVPLIHPLSARVSG